MKSADTPLISVVDSSQTRLPWPDLGRGVAVVVVVLYHTLLWIFLVGGSDGSVGYRAWASINEYLGLWRMPFLLLIVGIFASGSVADGRWTARLGRRILTPFYLYFIWLFGYFGLGIVEGEQRFPHVIHGWRDLLVQLVLPDTTLWFLFAVGTYIALAAICRRLRIPGWLVVALLSALWLVASAEPIPVQANKIIKYAVCFAVGFHSAGWFRRVTVRPSEHRRELLVLSGIAVTTSLVMWTGRGGALVPLVDLARCLSVVVLGIFLVAGVAKVPVLNRFGSVIGRRTLPIYVLHVPVLAGLLLVLPAVPPHLPFVLMALLPWVTVALVLALSLGLWWITQRLGLKWLFELPVRPQRLQPNTNRTGV